MRDPLFHESHVHARHIERIVYPDGAERVAKEERSAIERQGPTIA